MDVAVAVAVTVAAAVGADAVAVVAVAAVANVAASNAAVDLLPVAPDELMIQLSGDHHSQTLWIYFYLTGGAHPIIICVFVY